jgi:hypothetical protein
MKNGLFKPPLMSQEDDISLSVTTVVSFNCRPTKGMVCDISGSICLQTESPLSSKKGKMNE